MPPLYFEPTLPVLIKNEEFRTVVRIEREALEQFFGGDDLALADFIDAAREEFTRAHPSDDILAEKLGLKKRKRQ